MAAIVDGVKNAVQGQVAAAANRSVRAGLRKVAGNLLGINTQFSGPQLGATAPRYQPTKYTTKNLAYPLDVEEDPRQGHYIFFNINEQDKGKVKRQAFESEIRAHENKIRAEYEKQKSKVAQSFFGGGDTGIGQAGINVRSFEEIRIEYIRKHIIADYDGTSESLGGSTRSPGRKDSSSLQLQNPTTSRIKTAIALYMPPSVQVSYGAQYNDTEIGILADIGGGLIQGFKEGDDVKKMISQSLDKGGVAIKKMALGAIDTFAPGSKAIAQIQTGKAITPKMELMFSGIGRREFSYEFIFIPKSAEEAEVVKEIIYEFKYHMASDFIEGSGMREMDIPSTFDIAYHYLGKENESLNKISTCVLESVGVEYGGERFQAHKDGVPFQSKLSLKFKEMEIITKSRIVEGY